MIIKTRLANESPFYRLTDAAKDAAFRDIVRNVVEQWNISPNVEHSLLWRETDRKEEVLVIGQDTEWQLFCRLHVLSADEVVELQVIARDSLHKALDTATTSPKGTITTQAEHQPSTTEPASNFAFHSVEPQSKGVKKTYTQQAERDVQGSKMHEASTEAAAPPLAEPSGEEGDEMSAYDRVMARSRKQGESLNKLFGTITARRAGNTGEGGEDGQPAFAAQPVDNDEDNAGEEPTAEGEPSSPPRIVRSKEEITGMNSWLENAWESRLKQMGHSPNSGSHYAKLRVGKGKEREESNAPEATTSRLERREKGVSHSEEALEDVAPLQGLIGMHNVPISRTVAGQPFPSPSMPNSRPSSSSGFSTSGASAKKTTLSRLLNRSRHRNTQSGLFASQPASLYDSETATPDEGEPGRRKRTISFRSLSDALMREKRGERRGPTRPSTSQGLPVEEHSKEIHPSKTGLIGPLGEAYQTPAAQKNGNEVKRPTLLRAAHSTPLSSTAVNLSPAGGITLHVSSLAPTFATQAERGCDGARADLFDLMLPREIRIKCFEWLIQLHELDEQKQSGTGREAAVRELMRLTRVSHTWQSLLLDGQLWASVDTALLCDISNAALLRLARNAGPFIRKLDLQNAPNISSSLLVSMAISQDGGSGKEEVDKHKARTSVPAMSTLRTNTLLSLTQLNLSGCRGISTMALHNVLVRLPSLLELNVSNTDVVTDHTCLLLGASLPKLTALNVSRCPNMSGKGIVQFIRAGQGALYDEALFSPATGALESQEDIRLPLEALRAAGCVGVNSEVMQLLGQTMPSLQVLDLSYASDLRDDAIGALVAHPGLLETVGKVTKTTYQLAACQNSPAGPFVTLTPRQAGGNIQGDEVHHRRLLSSLRHISLSSCRRLTDRSCVYLAHAVPNLQYLELANIGPAVRDEGIIKLLETTPLIQRIDLEGASELGEHVVEAVTPDAAYAESIGLETHVQAPSWMGRRSLRRNRSEGERGAARGSVQRAQRPPPPGAHLTHLILSHVTKPDAACLLNLIRRCPRLTHLQLDDTLANDSILREFVVLSRQRRTRGAYLSLVDCRALSRSANADMVAQASVRPRYGKRGREFKALEYNDGATSRPASRRAESHQTAADECDDRLVVVKTFFNWETRSQQRRAEQRRNQRLNGGRASHFMARTRRDSLSAALQFIGGDTGEGTGRWGRLANGIMGQGDEAEDARACRIM